MSYGWLTESALLPTRAVPIRGVSDSSLNSLSNQIFSLQQVQQEQQQQGLCTPVAASTSSADSTFASTGGSKQKPIHCRSKFTGEGEERVLDEESWSSNGDGEDGEERSDEGAVEQEENQEEKGTRRKVLTDLQEKTLKRGTKCSETEVERSVNLTFSHGEPARLWKRPSRKPKTREELLFEEKNARVEERAARDEVEYKAEQKTIAASRKKLEEKARLYEELVSGRLDCSSAPAGARLVVDFEEKLWRKTSVSASSTKHMSYPAEVKTGGLTEDKLDRNTDALSNYCFLETQERQETKWMRVLTAQRGLPAGTHYSRVFASAQNPTKAQKVSRKFTDCLKDRYVRSAG